MKHFLYIFLLLLSFTSQAQFGDFGGSNKDNLELQVFQRGLENSFLNKATVKPGDTFEVLLDLKMKENWFVYWQVSGGISQKMDFAWETPDGISFVEMKFPYPRYKFDDTINSASFYNPKNPNISLFSMSPKMLSLEK